MKRPEKKCTECGGLINWKVIHGELGNPLYNGLCTGCNTIFRGRETPDLAKGREIAETKSLSRKELYDLPGDVQLGYLREKQHGKDGYLNEKN